MRKKKEEQEEEEDLLYLPCSLTTTPFDYAKKQKTYCYLTNNNTFNTPFTHQYTFTSQHTSLFPLPLHNNIIVFFIAFLFSKQPPYHSILLYKKGFAGNRTRASRTQSGNFTT